MRQGGARLATAVMAALVAGVVGAGAAAATKAWPTKKDGEFILVDSPHYLIKTDHTSEIAQMIASHQEGLFQELFRRMGSARPGAQIRRVQVTVASTREKYLSITGADGIGSQGLFTCDKIMAWAGPDEIDTVLETLRHEGTHQFVDQFVGYRCPIWLNEGLAEFFRNGQFKAGQLVVGQAPVLTVNFLKRVLAAGALMPTFRLLTMSDDEWLMAVQMGSIRGLIQYSEAWAMVYFLQGGDGGKYRGPFTAYINNLSKGRSPSDSWQLAFGANTMGGFEDRFRTFIKELKPSGGMDCQTGLLILGYMLMEAEDTPELYKDMETFRQAAIDGKLGEWHIPLRRALMLDSKDTDTIKALFHCSEDKRSPDTCSFEMVPGKGKDLPILRCKHHTGFIRETVYEKNEKGEVVDVNVASRIVAPEPKGPTPAKDRKGGAEPVKPQVSAGANP